MITRRLAGERRHETLPRHDTWRTFESEGPLSVFGNLHMLDENRLGPGASVTRQTDENQETVTYVREGTLVQKAVGHSAILRGGEFQVMTSVVRRRERNPSRAHEAHVFRISVLSTATEVAQRKQQKRFSAADRRGALCAVAAQDDRRGALHTDEAWVTYSALLARGQHLVHELSRGRTAWLHVIFGELRVGDLLLKTGDGAGVSAERAVSLTSHEASEILLIDLA